MVICLERGPDLHMAQLMPTPLTVSCFSKIEIGFTFLVLAHPGSPGLRAIKRLCVCVCVCGGIFTKLVTANLLKNLSPEIFQTSIKIRQRLDNGRDFGVFSPIVYRSTFDVTGYILSGHKRYSFLNSPITGTWIFHFF